jgi:SAM-dependent methyltransferase
VAPVLPFLHSPVKQIRRNKFAYTVFYVKCSELFGIIVAVFDCVFEHSVPLPRLATTRDASSALDVAVPWPSGETTSERLHGLRRRLRRERRRRKVGRAYDMALEVARILPKHSRVLDVGCGSGYIAHHLSAILGAEVTGLDLEPTTEASINYRQFDGSNFPVKKQAFDAVLLCYVLHHAQSIESVLAEVRRVLNVGGLVVVYEDIPRTWWDRMICSVHNRKWRSRTGPCTFRLEWSALFKEFGFEVISERKLSRWRNVAHPVARKCFVFKMQA